MGGKVGGGEDSFKPQVFDKSWIIKRLGYNNVQGPIKVPVHVKKRGIVKGQAKPVLTPKKKRQPDENARHNGKKK